MSSHLRIALLALCFSFTFAEETSNFAETDLTLDPYEKGRDVVYAVKHKLDLSGIFPLDDRFLVRVAWVESGFGTHNDTYIPNFQGGIWQVTQPKLDDTQSTDAFPHLIPLHALIESTFHISWMTVTMAELERPIYSGLAAALYLTTLPEAIPFTVSQQAQYWNTHYNSNSSVGIATFINAVTQLENVLPCTGKLDMVVVLDSSSSVPVPEFNDAKTLLAELVDRFSLEHIRLGLLMYAEGETATTIFPLNNTLTKAEMLSVIRNVTQIAGDNAHWAIRVATQQLRASEFREGAPQLIAVWYDGGGNSTAIRGAVTDAMSYNIEMYTVPIGNESNWQVSPAKENLMLTAGGEASHLLYQPPKPFVDASLNQFAYKLTDQVCRTSQHRGLNVGDVLLAGETRYYNYDLANVTLLAYMKQGAVTVYYSFTRPNPSPALNDGFFNASAAFSTGTATNLREEGEGHKLENTYGVALDGPQVYAAVRGVGALNAYTLIGIAN